MTGYLVPLIFRPLVGWPFGELRASWDRRSSPFSATYSTTRQLLDRELDMLGAPRAVVQLEVPEGGIYVAGDGLKANVRPEHPGVVLSFESVHGPLQYGTDRFEGWHDNLRAIALGLEALRRVDRYGLGSHGEQYAGWKAIDAAPGSVDDAAAFIAGLLDGWTAGDLLDWPGKPHRESVANAYRLAAKLVHPDAGGDTAVFQLLVDAKRVLDAAAGS